MPFIHVRVATPSLSPDQVNRLQRGVTDLMAGTLNKRAELTAVLVEPIGPDAGWSLGAAPVAVAAHLDATVTQGTNTAEQKTLFIRQADALLREVLGESLPLATYAVVTEVPGEAWGYGGRTQAARARPA